MKIKKGTIVRWNDNSVLYTVKKGVKAEVVEDFDGGNNFLRVKWLDKTSQMDGGYDMENFDIVSTPVQEEEKELSGIEKLELVEVVYKHLGKDFSKITIGEAFSMYNAIIKSIR